MKLYIEGDIGRYYVQTLCLIFFPGAGFSEREEETAESDAVRLTLREDAQSYTAEAIMRHGGEQRSASARELRDGIDSDERIKKRAVGRAIFEAGVYVRSGEYSPAFARQSSQSSSRKVRALRALTVHVRRSGYSPETISPRRKRRIC